MTLPVCDIVGKFGHVSAKHAMASALATEARKPTHGATFEGLSVWGCNWCGRYHWGHTVTQEAKDRIRCDGWRYKT